MSRFPVTSRQLAEARRYAIVAMFGASALLMPPDVVSQLSLAVPLLVLYEGLVLTVRRCEVHPPRR